jgi:threonine synthase
MNTVLTDQSLLQALTCSACGKSYDATSVHTFATCCNRPLLASYDLQGTVTKNELPAINNSMWRYYPLLPVRNKRNIISLGEGMTPLLLLKNASEKIGSSILLKDESLNPTGSFKARGISVAVSKAKELGIEKLITPTAGNAGGALAAYCAKACMHCVVIMPEQTPTVFKEECRLYGAELVLVKGLISDCAKKVEEMKKEEEYFDISTLKEPYRLEGKKTMGYEIAEQLNWQLPDVIVYPTGGGTGLIGIWKAFQEMLQLGWIKPPLPRMIAIQAQNCAPLTAAIQNPSTWKETFRAAPSVANGLVVPSPFAMDLMLQVIRESKGEVVTVSEEEILSGIKEMAKAEGILLSPEGSAAWKGLERLYNAKKIAANNKVVFLNTGSGYKYLENLKQQ